MPDSYKELLAQLAPSPAGFQLNRPAANRQKFEELVSWIYDNIDKTITLNDLLEQSGLSMYELTTQFMLNAKLLPLQFIKVLRQYKADLEQINQPSPDNTYALFDPNDSAKDRQ
jgi:transcriptional regulator GlxA family with amidase domain